MKKLLILLLFVSAFAKAQLTPVASKSFGTISDLRSQSGSSNTQVLLQGLNTINDGNGGIYMWDDLSTATDDGLSVIKVASVTTGRWLKMPNSNTIKGNVTFSSAVLQTAYVVNHGLSFAPNQIYIQARSSNAAVPSWVSNITSTSFTVNFASVPILGTNNITIDYLIIKF